MVVENPLALQYILPGDVFFLQSDRAALVAAAPVVQAVEEVATEPASAVIESVAVAPVVQAPVQVASPAIPAITSVAPQVVQALPVVEPTSPVTSQPTAPAFKYAGGYKKSFLVFVNYPQQPVMEPAHQAALEATIKRKDLSLDDIAIFNMGAHPGETLKAIGGFFKPQKMLFLGKDALPGGWNAPAFNQLIKMSKCDVLYTYSFGEMMGNKDITKAFWEQMKLL